ncbi:MAG: hypothetical protein JW910_07335 [Anaerolineae bacterium]|nr:hypothetical protein [Anaerolineae bacterium]
MPPLEAWERVWIDAGAYTQDIHGQLYACTECHGGQDVDDMEAAHTGLVADPSSGPDAVCGDCHRDVAPVAAESLHYTLEGYDVALHERSAPEHYETLEYMQSYHCNDCHASCGDCHISQPDSVGGGLLESHAFVATPPMSRTCTACHGSRVKNEYYGLNEGVTGDVHLRQARLACTDCHSADEMHGMGTFGEAAHRYDGAPEPACESCHADQVGAQSGIIQHQLHRPDTLSCQACHSVSYTNCTNCHVDRTEDDVPYYAVEAHALGFYLGRNPIQSEDRPYEYVPVRHVPIDINSFSAYGDDLLVNFLNRPTWTYATPHNIQRNTPQTETCTACHGNDAIFLTADKVASGELEANQDVIVPGAPPFPQGMERFLPTEEAPTEEAETEAGESEPSTDEDFWSSDSTQ